MKMFLHWVRLASHCLLQPFIELHYQFSSNSSLFLFSFALLLSLSPPPLSPLYSSSLSRSSGVWFISPRCPYYVQSTLRRQNKDVFHLWALRPFLFPSLEFPCSSPPGKSNDLKLTNSHQICITVRDYLVRNIRAEQRKSLWLLYVSPSSPPTWTVIMLYPFKWFHRWSVCSSPSLDFVWDSC